MMKNQKGITLIALVITIIVLLILAGVSIAMLTSDGGILNKAGTAAENSNVGEAKELAGVESAGLVSTYYEQKYVNNVTGLPATVGAYVKANMKGVPGKYEVNTTTGVVTITADGSTGTIQEDSGTIAWGE